MRLKIFLVLAVSLIAGCNTETYLVQPGQPVLTTKTVALPAGSWARLAGVDANGNPTWAVSTTPATVPPGYLIEPLPTAASQPSK